MDTITTLSQQTKNKMEKDAFTSIVNTCNLYGIRYLDLDKNMQSLILGIFNEGAKFAINELSESK